MTDIELYKMLGDNGILDKLDDQLKNTPEEQLRYTQSVAFKQYNSVSGDLQKYEIEEQIKEIEEKLPKTKNKNKIEKLKEELWDLKYNLLQITNPEIMKEIDNYLEGKIE